MGKRKIELKLITDKKLRYVSTQINVKRNQICYNKRKRGLIKKAMELVMLTDARLIMTIYDPIEGRFTTYSSHDKIEDFQTNDRKVIEEHFVT